jgi:hypothetical protein
MSTAVAPVRHEVLSGQLADEKAGWRKAAARAIGELQAGELSWSRGSGLSLTLRCGLSLRSRWGNSGLLRG